MTHAIGGVASSDVTIRASNGDDDSALERLAELDSRRRLRGRLLVAEVQGQIHAAYSLDERRAIADPFRHTGGLVALLELRARQLDGGRRRRKLRLPARRSMAPQPPGFRWRLLRHPR